MLAVTLRTGVGMESFASQCNWQVSRSFVWFTTLVLGTHPLFYNGSLSGKGAYLEHALWTCYNITMIRTMINQSKVSGNP